MDLTLVIFDTETAALRGPPHLLELGAVRASGGEIVDRVAAKGDLFAAAQTDPQELPPL